MSDADGAPPREGESRSLWRDATAVALIACVAFALYLARTDFHVYPREDTVQTVVAAEELSEGNGFTTRVTTPSVLTFLDRRGSARPPWPNMLRSPLPCLMIAALSRVTSQPMATALSSGIFFVLSVPLIYLIAHRLGGRTAGLFAAVTYIVARSGLWFAATGLTESSTIFALAGVTYCMMLPASAGACLAAGVFAAIGYLGRSTFTIWALPIIIYIVWHSRREGSLNAATRALAFAIPLAISVVWWGATIGAVAGEFGASGQSDIIIRVDTGLYPGRSPALTLEYWDVGDFIRAYPVEVAEKYGRIAQQTWPWLVDMGGIPLLVAFFFVEAFVVLARGKRVRVHWLLYALILIQTLMLPLASEGHGGVGRNRYLDPFGPIAAALGAAFAVELLRDREVSLRQALLPMALVVGLTAIPVMFNVAVGPYHGAVLERQQRIGAELARRAEPGDVVASTKASVDAWTSGLHAVYLPLTPAELQRMREMVEVDWIHVGLASTDLAARTEAWETVIEGEDEPRDFRFVTRFEDGSVLLKRVE